MSGAPPRTLMAGDEVGDIFVDGRTYDVQVWTKPDARHSVDSVRDMLIDTPTGQRVRLAEVADVRVLPTPNIIKREARFPTDRRPGQRQGARSRRRRAATCRRVWRRLSFPLGYHAVLQGEYRRTERRAQRLDCIPVLAVAGIFLLLQVSFSRWRLALLSFLTLPSALVGGVLATWLAGGVISLGSLVGFLTVLGIAARNGIMMINHFQHLERYEGERSECSSCCAARASGCGRS